MFQWWFKFTWNASTKFVLPSKSDLRSRRLFTVCMYLSKMSILYSTMAICPYLSISVNVCLLLHPFEFLFCDYQYLTVLAVTCSVMSSWFWASSQNIRMQFLILLTYWNTGVKCFKIVSSEIGWLKLLWKSTAASSEGSSERKKTSVEQFCPQSKWFCFIEY